MSAAFFCNPAEIQCSPVTFSWLANRSCVGSKAAWSFVSSGNERELMEEAREHLLIAEIRAGEHTLFHELIRPYERRAFLVAYAILRNPDDAEDAVQQGMVKIFLNLNQLQDGEKFPQWALRIVQNEARMWKRKRHDELYESLDGADREPAEPANVRPRQFADWRELPSEVLEQGEVRAAIQDALNTLPEIYREIFVLRDMEHLNVAETAEILKINVPAVKVRLHRARLMMREALSPIFATHTITFWEQMKGMNPWSSARR